MVKIWKMTIIYLLIICGCSPKIPHVNESTRDCGKLRKGNIEPLIAPVNYFRNELDEFYSKHEFAYQFIYLVSPTDDIYGFLVWLKVKDRDSEIAELVIGNPTDKRRIELKNRELLSLVEAVETGGFYQLCNDEHGKNTFYLSALKAGSTTMFQYQGINSEMPAIKSDELTNAKKLCQALMR